MILSFALQSAGDSSMSSGSLGDRRSDSPEFRSLSPQGILSFGNLFIMEICQISKYFLDTNNVKIFLHFL